MKPEHGSPKEREIEPKSYLCLSLEEGNGTSNVIPISS